VVPAVAQDANETFAEMSGTAGHEDAHAFRRCAADRTLGVGQDPV
jgi:hypothetical protein